MALCDVALGRCHDTRHYDMTLNRPPDDFDSVHGVRSSDDAAADFQVGIHENYSFFSFRHSFCLLIIFIDL